MGAGLVILIALLLLEKRPGSFPGRTSWSSSRSCIRVLRFIIEFYRGDDRGLVLDMLSTSRFISVVLGPLSLIMLWIPSPRQSSRGTRGARRHRTPPQAPVHMSQGKGPDTRDRNKPRKTAPTRRPRPVRRAPSRPPPRPHRRSHLHRRGRQSRRSPRSVLAGEIADYSRSQIQPGLIRDGHVTALALRAGQGQFRLGEGRRDRSGLAGASRHRGASKTMRNVVLRASGSVQYLCGMGRAE